MTGAPSRAALEGKGCPPQGRAPSWDTGRLPLRPVGKSACPAGAGPMRLPHTAYTALFITLAFQLKDTAMPPGRHERDRDWPKAHSNLVAQSGSEDSQATSTLADYTSWQDLEEIGQPSAGANQALELAGLGGKSQLLLLHGEAAA